MDREIALNKRLTSPNRFQKIDDREDRSDMPVESVIAQSKGKFLMQHRGCSILKGSDDMVIFQELFWRLRPATVIELGTCSGGSALWMADMLKLMEVDTTIYSLDIDQSNIEERVKMLKPKNVHFIQGDSFKIEETFTDEMLQSLPHPWLVVEDAHVNVEGIMKHFGSHMHTGDYFVIEDLHPDLPTLGFGYVYDIPYKPGMYCVQLMKNFKAFLNKHVDDFAVDSFYTDFFGYNGTWNMHGYIRKM